MLPRFTGMWSHQRNGVQAKTAENVFRQGMHQRKIRWYCHPFMVNITTNFETLVSMQEKLPEGLAYSLKKCTLILTSVARATW